MADINKSNYGFDNISQLAKLLKENDLGELTIKDGDFSISIKAKIPQVFQSASPIATSNKTSAVSLSDEIGEIGDFLDEDLKKIDGNVVKSPIVGTFYSSSAPDKPPFVTVGQAVKKGDTLFIIESMKLMNEIQSEFDGTVKEFLVTDGQGVEFHQPVIIIK